MSDTLLRTLAQALADLAVGIDLSDDEDVTPEAATRLFENTSHLLDQLTPTDRRRLSALWRELAEQETLPSRREALQELPDSFGLDDPD